MDFRVYGASLSFCDEWLTLVNQARKNGTQDTYADWLLPAAGFVLHYSNP